MNRLTDALTAVRGSLAWLPDPVVSVLIVLLAAIVALALHRMLQILARRSFARRSPNLYSALAEMRGLTRLALLVLAMFVAIPAAPIEPFIKLLLEHILLMAIIALVGWTAITAMHIAASVYLRRFRTDSADNLLARKHTTQVRVLLRSADVLLGVITVGAMLMTVPEVRQYGISLLTSAGVAGLIVGLAARPVLSNLFAGVQIAMAQPIRLEDAVIVEGEWGNIEEITSTYVVVRLWDLRRLIVPLSYFIEKPFQNWTRESSTLIGTVLIYVDYRAPVGVIRAKAGEIVKASKLWDGRVINVAVTDLKQDCMQVRILASAADAGKAFDLRCEIRERLIDWLQRELPQALPRVRSEAQMPPHGGDRDHAQAAQTAAATAGDDGAGNGN
jgi:small-conductance mechanosensitive channel